MTVKELSKDELSELKQNYLIENGQQVSYGMLADVNSLVTDERMYEEYEGVDFVPDDFFCNQ